jgi:hypothetical protein
MTHSEELPLRCGEEEMLMSDVECYKGMEKPMFDKRLSCFQ